MEADRGDAFLIEGIRAGDQRAWRQLIERYRGRLLAFARQLAPSLADAEDVVQDTMIGFATSLPGFDASRSLETYLFTIARYKLYDLLRQKRLPTQAPPADADDWWDTVAVGAAETPSGLALSAEAEARQRQRLSDALRRLIYDLRDRGAFEDLQVIELLFYMGKRNLEVAELMDMDQKAIAGVKFRAIQKLQRFLEETADDDERPGKDEPLADIVVSNVWREDRLTCLKRSTLGSYALGVLDEPWKSFTQFHMDVVGCPMCVANYQDILADEDDGARPETEQLFASSVGFLKPSRPGEKSDHERP